MTKPGDDPGPSEPHREEGGGDGTTTPRSAPLTPDLELREVRRGTKPGSRYVRLTPRKEQPFRRVGEGEFRATEVALRPRSATERVWRDFKRIVVGTPLATSQLIEERLGKLKALAVYASDMLSSSAYATEEILLILILAGTAALTWSIPIALAIAVLVGIVALSYSQVIRGYPGGGGSYAVAKENLGTLPGLVAGSSLVVDYTLTVAVSTAAGVAAIVSAVPSLHDLRIEIAVGSVAIITLANLRGLRESGTYFAIPAYLFIVSLAAMIVTGLVRLALGHDITAAAPPHPIEIGGGSIGLFLILRAFASGSAALTGIEAVSNGVPSFKKPEARNANITLAWMVSILTFFFIGLTILAHQMDIVPSGSMTVVAQIAQGVFGKNALFYTVQVATTLILLLAANTSFAGLPALASVMARDRFIPRQFAFRGDRLAFSNGIIVLGAASAGLLVIFGAETHRLIPLYAVGVFTGFTLSQVGMVLHWRHDPSPSARLSLIVNAVGAIATGVVTVIIGATKFVDGAWLTIAAIAAFTVIFSRINHHYRHVAERLSVATAPPLPPVTPLAPVQAEARGRGRAVLMPVDELNQAVLHTLEFARTFSDNVTAVHITDELEDGETLREAWERTVPDTPIVNIESPYRSFVAPMLTYIDAIDRVDPGAYITVVLPEFVPAHFWEGWLHNQSAGRLKRALRHRKNTVLINVPYHLAT
jgi:amino acid transporter